MASVVILVEDGDGGRGGGRYVKIFRYFWRLPYYFVQLLQLWYRYHSSTNSTESDKIAYW